MAGIKRTYIYNAQAHALSGHISRPFQETIEVQAGMSLPSTGGYGSVRVENFRLKEVASFKAAHTHVMGSFDEHTKNHTTLVSTTLEGLNLLDVVTADRIVMRMASHFHLDNDANQPVCDSEPHITVFGSHFENLRIGGCPVEVILDHKRFLELDTFGAFLNKLDSDGDFRKMALDPYKTGKPHQKPEQHGIILCSLVERIKVDCPGVEQEGHVLKVKEFGTIYLAEMIAEHSRRALTMLRFELGSPGGGGGSGGSGQSNGKTYPPPP